MTQTPDILCSILLQLLLLKSNTAQLPSQTLPPVWRTKWQRLIRSTALRNGLLVGLSFVLSFVLSDVLSLGLGYGLKYELSFELKYGLNFVLSYGLSQGLSYGLSQGLSYGLSTGLLSLLLIGKSMTVQVTDRLIWSWTSLGRSLRLSQHVRATLQIAALVGLNVGLFIGTLIFLNIPELSVALGAVLIFGLIQGLIIGLSIGLSYWLLIGLFQGISSETIGDQQRMAPNQGIRRSAFNGLVLGCISAMSVVLSVVLSAVLSVVLSAVLSFRQSAVLSAVLSQGLSERLRYGLSYVLIIGLSAGLLAFLLKGGLASLRHYVLRFLLWRSDAIPWNFSRFLDNAYEQILLRKVGGAIFSCIGSCSTISPILRPFLTPMC